MAGNITDILIRYNLKEQELIRSNLKEQELIRYNLKEQELMFAEDSLGNMHDNIKLQTHAPRFIEIKHLSLNYKDEDPQLSMEFDNQEIDEFKIEVNLSTNLVFDNRMNSYYITTSFDYRKIILCYTKEVSHRDSDYSYEKKVREEIIHNIPYYDSLYLNDDFLYSSLLFAFIQKQKLIKYYSTYDYKYIISDLYNDKDFMLSIIQIRDYVRDNCKDIYIASLLLYAFIQQRELLVYPEDISNDKNFMSLIFQIQDCLMQKFNKNGIIYNIISYL